MEPAPLFNNPRGDNAQVIYLDDYRVPTMPVIDGCWVFVRVPEAEESGHHVCPCMMAPEVVRDAQIALTVPAYDYRDEAVRLPPPGLIHPQRFYTSPQPVDIQWQFLRSQQGPDFAQRDAACMIVGENFVDNPVTCYECQQCYMANSEFEVPSQQQWPTTTPPASATTTANSYGVDPRQHKVIIPVDPTTKQKKKKCTGRSVLGLQKVGNAQLKKKATSAILSASQRRSRIIFENERRQALSSLYETLYALFQLEKSEISARTNKATVVLKATNRIVLLEARVQDILEELKTPRRSRNFSSAMEPAYFSASVRLRLVGLGQMSTIIYRPEEVRQPLRLLLELLSRVIEASGNHPAEMFYLNISTVQYVTSYTLHYQADPGSDFAVNELHTTLQMVVNCELIRTQLP